MEKLLKQLTISLDQQVLLHQDLLNLLKQESENLGKHSASELMQLHAKKHQKVRQIATEEQHRLQTTHQLAQELSLTQDTLQTITISILEKHFPPKTRQHLQKLKAQLLELMQTIADLATQTADIANARLKPIEASLQFLQKQQHSPSTYSVTGNLATPHSAYSRFSV